MVPFLLFESELEVRFIILKFLIILHLNSILQYVFASSQGMFQISTQTLEEYFRFQQNPQVLFDSWKVPRKKKTKKNDFLMFGFTINFFKYN